MFKQLINSLFVSLFKISWIKEYWSRRYQGVQSSDIPWATLKKPLHQCRISLVTTGGVHLKTETPFDMEDPQGDPSFRIIPSQSQDEDLTITHNYYDHQDADEDLNLVFPLKLLREFVQQGIVQALSARCYGFMGHVDGSHIPVLMKETARQVAKHMKEDKTDIALLVPA